MIALRLSAAEAQAPASDSVLVRELRHINGQVLRAEQERDTAMMRALISADFTWIRYDGARFGRDARIRAVANGRRNPTSPAVLEEQAQLIATDVAIGIRKLRLLLGTGEDRRDREVWETRVYIRSASGWRLFAQHSTAVPDSTRP